MSYITIHTDGSYLPESGTGGWAAYIETKNSTTLISGGCKGPTTNQRMELQAILEALMAIHVPSKIHIYSDSKYCVNIIKKWLKAWKKNGWKTKSEQPVKNKDIISMIDELLQPHKVTISWVKSHANNDRNNKVDEAARDEAKMVA